MLILISIAGAYAGWRVVRAAVQSLGHLPRSNEDMIHF